jgi:hypothetical protein
MNNICSWDVRFSQQWLWIWLSSRMWHHVVLWELPKIQRNLLLLFSSQLEPWVNQGEPHNDYWTFKGYFLSNVFTLYKCGLWKKVLWLREILVSRFWRIYMLWAAQNMKKWFWYAISLSLFVYVCVLLAPEWLDGFYLYSVFKSLSAIRRCPMNSKILVPKTEAT